jgi:anti-sigma B factor antagonist
MSPVVPKFELGEQRSADGVDVVSISGEIHLSTAPRFREALDTVIENGDGKLVLDLSAVEFIDSTGLSVLLNALRLINQRQGHMAIVCSNPTVLRLFEITSLDATFEIFVDRAGAIARVTGPGYAGGSSAGAP